MIVSSSSIDLPSVMNIFSPSRTVEWADLATLDLSTFDQPGGKQKLADQLFNAIQKIGTVHHILRHVLCS